MALTKQFETRMGVSGEYINFDPVICNKVEVTMRMNFWKDAETRLTADAIPFNDGLDGSRTARIVGFDTLYAFVLDLNSVDNIYKQGYDYLKTLPEFEGALDA